VPRHPVPRRLAGWVPSTHPRSFSPITISLCYNTRRKSYSRRRISHLLFRIPICSRARREEYTMASPHPSPVVVLGHSVSRHRHDSATATAAQRRPRAAHYAPSPRSATRPTRQRQHAVRRLQRVDRRCLPEPEVVLCSCALRGPRPRIAAPALQNFFRGLFVPADTWGTILNPYCRPGAKSRQPATPQSRNSTPNLNLAGGACSTTRPPHPTTANPRPNLPSKRSRRHPLRQHKPRPRT